MSAPVHTGTSEPVTIAGAVQAALAIATIAGWVTIDSDTLMVLASAVTILITAAVQGWARWRVTPLVSPRDTDGVPLVRSDS
ncbi:MAG: hypothetical protein ACRCZP_17625 [Phycicoccus sp.]